MSKQPDTDFTIPWLQAPMTKRQLMATALSAFFPALPGCAPFHGERSRMDIGYVDINPEIKLRRMVVRAPNPRGVVLFLHGFPETLYTWKNAAEALGSAYEVHAFDWPGFGLSSRPPANRFAYAPRDYANVLRGYIEKSGIETSSLVIYGTDIGALPSLLLAIDQPKIAKAIIVGDFAPFDRPQYMNPRLQSLKTQSSSEAIRIQYNNSRDETLENAFRRGLSKEEQFELSQDYKDDLRRGWNQGGDLTAADAFFHYYSHFTRDQNHFESNLNRLRTPVKVVWGEKDIYIKTDMGAEFARRTNSEFTVLPGIGHYPHLQNPKQTSDEIRALFER
jgi:pimeloyl-ACP methyl ester carboxylesterase